MTAIPECDWKYMSKIKPELLNRLCGQICAQSIAILQNDSGSEHERYLKNYKHIQNSDRIIGECFDDWKRSMIFIKITNLQHYRLLSKEQFEKLSVETQQRLNVFSEL